MAYFTSELSPDGLASQMASIGLDVSQSIRTNKLIIYPMPEPTEGEEAGPILSSVTQAIERGR